MKKITLRLELWKPIPAVLYEGKGLPAVEEEPRCCFQTPVNLTTGHADFLDVAGAILVRQFGQRAELLPVVTILPGAAGAVGVRCHGGGLRPVQRANVDVARPGANRSNDPSFPSSARISSEPQDARGSSINYTREE
jgi:hypothetical protein